jgi:cytidylate kinase
MAEKLLVPAIEKRIESLIEISRRNLGGYSVKEQEKKGVTITISREFGCEGYPAAEKLQELLQKKTGTTWGLIDKALFEEVARNHNFPEDIFRNLGEKNRFIDDMMSTFSPSWKSDKDYYKLLCKQITAFADAGNVIIVGRGAGILTQKIPNCFQFRIIAPMPFKIASITKRLNVSDSEAEKLINSNQKKRDAFVKDFLNRDVSDLTLYHTVFNNAKNSAAQIAAMILSRVL